jgi:putative transposase
MCVNEVPPLRAGVLPAYARPMPRRPRNLLRDGIHHVTARGVADSPIFLSDADRHCFLQLLNDAIARFRWKCHAMCLMDTHYHLVLETSLDRLSAGLHWLNGAYALRFNAAHKRKGHLFGDRFWSSLIESEQHLVEACRYVMFNPVRAGLCEEPADWPWSRSRYGFDVA